MNFLLQPQQHLAFLGDERLGQAPNFILERIERRYYPVHGLNHAQPGLTLAQALEQPVIAADMVLLAVGMHDGLRAMLIAEFSAAYRQLLLPYGTRAIVSEPCALEPADIAQLEPYLQAVHQLAAQTGLRLVQFQRALNRVLTCTNPSDWGTGYCLNRFGSAVISEEFLGAVGFEVFEDDDEFPEEAA